MRRKRASVNARLHAHARQKKSARIPPMTVRNSIVERARGEWDVFGVYIGQKKKNGRWLREVGLICLTTTKTKPHQLRPEKRIPKTVAWRERRRTYRIRTDVIEAAPTLELQSGPILGPGDGVSVGASRASIGAAIIHPNFGRCVTTAGHLFGGPGAIGTTAFGDTGSDRISTTVMQCVMQQEVDYALLLPDEECDCDNLFQDLIRIGPVHVPDPSEVGRPLFVLDGLADSRPTACRGVNAMLELSSGVYQDVILTDAVTDRGHSGTALVDSENRLWGFLIGAFDEFSIFMPAHILLWREQSLLL